jgi:hypothetical protein
VEHLVGLHPDDPAYKTVKAEIAEITLDKLTVVEAGQLKKTLDAIESSRRKPLPPIPVPKNVPPGSTATA